MATLRYWLLWSALSVLLGALSLGVLSGTPAFQKCTAESRHETNTEKPPEDSGVSFSVLLRCAGGAANYYSGAITAIATIAIAAFTGTLWITNIRQLRLARDEFHATHRPKILCLFFERIPIKNENDAGIKITCVNAGPMPAFLMEIGTKILMVRTPASQKIEMDVTKLGRQKVISGEEVAIDRRDLAASLAQVIGENPDIAPETPTPCICVGYIAYEDATGRRRKTGFCRSWDYATKTWVRVENSEYEYAY